MEHVGKASPSPSLGDRSPQEEHWVFLPSEPASLQPLLPILPTRRARVLQEQFPTTAHAQDPCSCYRDDPPIIPITSSKDEASAFMLGFH